LDRPGAIIAEGSNAWVSAGKRWVMAKPGEGCEQSIGAAEQLEELFRSHYAAVVSYARRRAGADSVDDVVAETFLVAWQRLEHVPAESLPWLLRDR
jgi:DNA-directed RNA polymerase specialized sigma24 family protein